MTVAVPVSSLSSDAFHVNTRVDGRTLDPLGEPLPGPKYTIKYHHAVIDKLVHGVLDPGASVHDLTEIVGIRNVDFLISLLESFAALSSLLQHERPVLIVHFNVGSGNRQGFLEQKVSHPWVKQVDHGLSVLLAVERTDGQAIDKTFVDDVIRILDDGDHRSANAGRVTVVQDWSRHVGDFELGQIHDKVYTLIDDVDAHSDHQIRVNNLTGTSDHLDADQAQAVYLQILSIKRLVHELAVVLNGVSWSQNIQELSEARELHSRITQLQRQVEDIHMYSLELIEDVLKLQFDVDAVSVESLKKAATTPLADYLQLLEAMHRKLSMFKQFQGYFLFLVRYRRIPSETRGSKYLIVFTELQTEVYQVCAQQGWILCYSEDWYVPEEPAIFHFSGEDEFYGGGWLRVDPDAENHGSDSSEALFDRPSRYNANKRLYICHECREFVHVHRRDPDWISCRCGGFELQDVRWSMVGGGERIWERFLEEQMRVIDTREVINKYYIYFYDYLEELLQIWMDYNGDTCHVPYVREAVYGRLAESLPSNFPSRQRFIAYAAECGFVSSEFNKWTPAQIHSQFRRLLLENHFPIDIRYHFNHFIVQNWQF